MKKVIKCNIESCDRRNKHRYNNCNVLVNVKKCYEWQLNNEFILKVLFKKLCRKIASFFFVV